MISLEDDDGDGKIGYDGIDPTHSLSNLIVQRQKGGSTRSAARPKSAKAALREAEQARVRRAIRLQRAKEEEAHVISERSVQQIRSHVDEVVTGVVELRLGYRHLKSVVDRRKVSYIQNASMDGWVETC